MKKGLVENKFPQLAMEKDFFHYFIDSTDVDGEWEPCREYGSHESEKCHKEYARIAKEVEKGSLNFDVRLRKLCVRVHIINTTTKENDHA